MISTKLQRAEEPVRALPRSGSMAYGDTKVKLSVSASGGSCP